MKIGIVGSGLVGATAAYALVMKGIGREIVLIDANGKRSRAEADDILHAVPFASPIEIYPGQYSDLTGCRVVIIAAGVNQKPGETRLHLLERNAAIFKEIIPEILNYAGSAVLLVATNPVDIMTHIAGQVAGKSGVPSGRIIGSGTTLDTARFRSLLGKHLGVDSHHVHAYVIGEHGDSEVLAWSMVSIGGIPLSEFSDKGGISLDPEFRRQVDLNVRQAAYRIIEGKGATYYGIGSALARIVGAILYDQRAILTVSTFREDIAGVHDVTISLPSLVGGKGILSQLPLPIDADEEKALRQSATILKEFITQLEPIK